jgi:hypothetical protein
MKTLLTALLPAAMTLTGCLCGGWEGQDDQVLRTANGDAMQVCSNGGYSVMMANGTLFEGHLSDDGTVIAASVGETGARAFTMTTETNGSKSSPELGIGWTPITLDQVELDHAHVQCADLETRAWWPNSAAYLPATTAFSRTTYGVTEEILLCADGTARVPSITGEPEVTSYTSEAGKISVYGSLAIDGLYTPMGTLAAKIPGQKDSVWTRTAVAAGRRCE